MKKVFCILSAILLILPLFACTGTGTQTSSAQTGGKKVPTNTTYYISSTGNDKNDGTSENKAWATVAPINKIIKFGEGCKILFEGGSTFDGGMVLKLLGTAENPIIIGSYGEGKATLKPIAPRGTPIIKLLNSEGFEIQNLKLEGDELENYPGLDFVSGGDTSWCIEIRSDREEGEKLNHIYIDNVEFRNMFGGAWIGADKTAEVDGYNDVRLTNCIFDKIFQYGCYVIGYGNIDGGPVDQHTNIYVGHNEFYNINGDPNYNSEAQPLNVSCASHILIEYNYFKDNCGYGGANMQNPNGGSTSFSVNNCRDFKVLYNEVTGTKCTNKWDGCAIDCDQDAQDGEVAFNLTYNNDGPSLQLGSFKGKTTGNIDFHHNISYNDAQGTQPGSIQGLIRFFGSTENCRFFNNTFVLTGYNQGKPSGVSFEEVEQIANTNHKFFNNLFKLPSGIAVFRPNGSGDYNLGILSDTNEIFNNCYDSGTTTIISSSDFSGNAKSFLSLDEWAAIGAETHDGTQYLSIVADAGLPNLKNWEVPEEGFIKAGTLRDIDYFDLSDSSACAGKAFAPWELASFATEEDYHGTADAASNIGACG